jgi:hypothetical protein
MHSAPQRHNRSSEHSDMPLVRFTQNIQRHVKCPQRQVEGSSLRAALDDYFSSNQAARGYVLDEQGTLRKHMAIFINGKPTTDREQLTDRVTPECTIDVMQALSGG